MAGILDDKQRIMDVIITENGRRQIADGTFEMKYASFSDHGVFYRDAGNGTPDDAGSRLMFESYSSNSDVIIPEINQLGKISLDITSGKRIVNGQIVSTGSDMREASFTSGSQNIFSGSEEIVRDAIDSFDNLQIIGTKNNWALSEYFKLDQSQTTFDKPSATYGSQFKHVDMMGPIFTDPALVNLPAFRYLPPKATAGGYSTPMAIYRRLTELPTTDFQAVKQQAQDSSIASTTVQLSSDNPNLNILAQMFEINDTDIGKLAIVDYGTYKNPDGSDAGSVFHLGKIFRDSNNVPKFVKIFTLVFE
tara:strand:+ start:63 stop:980 length:918 start_codon:yes stop_codon:yes gene_type:complete